MANLYQLAESYRELANQIEEYDLDPETMINTLEGSSELMSIEEKAGNIIRLGKNLEADIIVYDLEIKRMEDRRKAIKNRVDSLKDYLKSSMELAGIDKIKIDTFSISLQNNPPAVKINDERAVGAEYLTIVPAQYVPDKNKIKEDLKAGMIVPGCELTVGRSLRIR
ncbi:MAG TPA: siphovirus Gp157 family protein [Negativicutes bacterium]